MHLIIYLLLNAVFLVPITLQHECAPFPVERGCTQAKENNDGVCVSKVFCVGSNDISWDRNAFPSNHYHYYDQTDQTECNNLFRWNAHMFGETIYSMKNFIDAIILQNSDVASIVTTVDLSCNGYSDTPIINTANHLKSLNLSQNSLVDAKLYNSYNLNELSYIDLSHNLINNIIIDENKHVYVNLRNINLSHNYFVMINDNIFESFKEVEHLDLSYNFIDYISIGTFEGLKNLLYLNLNHNRISVINNSFFRFSKLKELYLSENKIQIISDIDYEKMTNLRILDISNNDIIKIDDNSFRNAHFINTLNLRKNLLENVNKEIFNNMNALKNIDLSENRMKYLPKDLFKDKSIALFSITENKLEGSLVKGIFEGLSLITELDLSNQRLTSVEDFAFFGLGYLKELFLNGNNLRILSKKSFNTLQRLEKLDLSNNQLTNIQFEKNDLVSLQSLFLQGNLLTQVRYDFFNALNSLRFLDLSHNNITQLETNSFYTLKDLINFQIANNPISGALEENTFDGLNSLPILDISGTLLNTIKNGSFNGMNQLRQLNASHCNISNLQYNLFLNTGFLDTLDLSFNKLETFDINKTELSGLEKLIMNNNLFIKLSSTFLKGLPRLTHIVLSHNKIDIIDEKGFEYQKDLRYLDLSYNKNLRVNSAQLAEAQNLISIFLSGIFTNVTFTTELSISRIEMSHSNIYNVSYVCLQNLKNLDYLVLRNNEIIKIDAKAFNGIKKIKEIDLSFNKITSIQSGAFKENKLLQFLNISHNMLTSVNYGIFTGLIYLETIDISYNEISDLRGERFYEVQSLSTLIADHNNIKNINSDDFSGINLKILSIGDNPIPCDVIINLRKSGLSFDITAIRLEDSGDHQHNLGVICSVEDKINQNHVKVDNLNNEILLSEIKGILINISSNSVNSKVVTVMTNETEHITNIVDKIGKMNSDLNSTLMQGNFVNINNSLILEKISAGTNNTTTLLEKLVKVLTETKKSDPIIIPALPKDNFTAESLIPLINKIRQDLEDTIAAERKNMYNEIDKKISNKLITSKPPIVPLATSEKLTHEAYSSKENMDSNSIIFLEVCVGLILVMMVGFILLNFYNSGMFIPNRRSTSSRHLADAMDNSTL